MEVVPPTRPRRTKINHAAALAMLDAGMRQVDVAAVLGCTQEGISQVKTRTARRLEAERTAK